MAAVPPRGAAAQPPDHHWVYVGAGLGVSVAVWVGLGVDGWSLAPGFGPLGPAVGFPLVGPLSVALALGTGAVVVGIPGPDGSLPVGVGVAV